MRTNAFALLLALAACGPEVKWIDRDGWVMQGDPRAVPNGVDFTLAAARELSPCGIEPWGGWIVWTRAPFDCAGIPAVAGCFTGHATRRAEVTLVGCPLSWPDCRAGDTALAHELAHYLFDRCEGDATHSPAHLALTLAIRSRALEIEEAGMASKWARFR